MATKPIAFITDDIPLSDSDYIIETINSYNPLRYLIVFEHPLGPKGFPHYHYLVWFTENNYNAFIKKVRDKYKLRGKAQKNLRKQYGRIKNIKSLEKLQSYMMKDQALVDLLDDDKDDTGFQENQSNKDNIVKYWKLNISNEDLKKYQDASFKKDNITETCYKAIKYVNEQVKNDDRYRTNEFCKFINGSEVRWCDGNNKEKEMKLWFIQFHVEKKLRLNKTTINNYYLEWIRDQYEDENVDQDITTTTNKIYDKLFN